MSDRAALILFARAGAPDAFAPLDERDAAELRAAFLADVMEREREVRVTVVEDVDGLPAAAEAAFARGARAVVMRTVETPLLSLEREEDAFAELMAGADVVLAPDLDGGFALLGTSRPRAELLPELLERKGYPALLLRARETAARVATLPPEPAVRTYDALLGLAGVLARSASARAFTPRTAERVLAWVALGRLGTRERQR